MVLLKLDIDFVVCKLPDTHGVNLTQDFVFLAKTDEEVSLVCPANLTPQNAIAIEAGWSVLKIEGVLDFGMVGVLAGIAGVLAEERISVFVVSTYNTDYIFVKTVDLSAAVQALTRNGYSIRDA